MFLGWPCAEIQIYEFFFDSSEFLEYLRACLYSLLVQPPGALLTVQGCFFFSFFFLSAAAWAELLKGGFQMGQLGKQPQTPQAKYGRRQERRK